MVSRIIIFVILATFILSAALATGDTIYTWTDKNGVLHMTNIPPVQTDEKVDTIEIEPPALIGEPEIQYAQPEKNLPSKNETEIQIINNHVIVPVIITYKQKKIIKG